MKTRNRAALAIAAIGALTLGPASLALATTSNAPPYVGELVAGGDCTKQQAAQHAQGTHGGKPYECRKTAPNCWQWKRVIVKGEPTGIWTGGPAACPQCSPKPGPSTSPPTSPSTSPSPSHSPTATPSSTPSGSASTAGTPTPSDSASAVPSGSQSAATPGGQLAVTGTKDWLVTFVGFAFIAAGVLVLACRAWLTRRARREQT